MRVIIILMAAGLVLIGIFPFRRDLRSGFEHARAAIKREMHSVLPGGSSSGSRSGSRVTETAGSSERGSARAAMKSPSEASKGAKKPKLDHLSEDDRASLDELLNR